MLLDHLSIRKISAQDSIILSKRYANISRNQQENHTSEDYIHDFYTPRRSPRLLTKSISVDTAPNKFKTPTLNNDNISNAKSNPNVSKEDSLGRTKLLNYFLKRTLGEKTYKTINKLRNKTESLETNDNKLPNNSEYENSIIKQDEVPDINCLSYGYHRVDNSPYIVHNNQSNKLKHRDVSKQTFSSDTYTKEASKEFVSSCDKIRLKTKYSPPPESESRSLIPVQPVSKNIDSSVTGVKESETDRNSGINNKNSKVTNMLRSGLRLKERLVVGLSVFAVVFTLILVIDIQMDLGLSGKHLVPSHGKVKYVVQEEGPGSAYNRFRNRLLQKTHR